MERRLERLAEELVEDGVPVLDHAADREALLEELAYALRPPVHEQRVPTYGAIVVPAGRAEEWAERVGEVDLVPVVDHDDVLLRRFADGSSSYVLRCPGGITHLVCFDRDVDDEHRLVELQRQAGGSLVQRDARSVVRVFGDFGVVRWTGVEWIHQPPSRSYVAAIEAHLPHLAGPILDHLLEFALHELSAHHIGATLVWKTGECHQRSMDLIHGTQPPRLSLRSRSSFSALRSVLGQVDGATVFSHDGTLLKLGVRLVPSLTAEHEVPVTGGTRHVSATRFSFDQPEVPVVVVSEDGPVTVLLGGEEVLTLAPATCRSDAARVGDDPVPAP